MSTHASVSLPRQRRIGPGLVVLLVFGVLLAALLLAAAWTWLASRRQLAAELERIRRSGEPISAEDLDAYYEVPPDGRDTTKIWLTAVAPLDTAKFQADGKGLPIVGEPTENLPLPGEPWPPLDGAEQLLAKYERSLEGMHRAARLGGRARFPIDFTDGVRLLPPYLQQLRMGARLLALETIVNVHRGRPIDAVESVKAIFAVARSLELEPIMISQLVRMALGGNACERTGWLLSAGILDDDQLASLDAELAASDYQQSLRRALMGERVIGLQTFADPDGLKKQFAHLRFTPFLDADQVLYLQVMAELIAAAEETGSARLTAVAGSDALIKAQSGATGAQMRYPMTFLLTPSLQPFAESVSRHEAVRDATRLAIAVERFRRKQGRLPDTLDELVPRFVSALLDDPFSGKSLQYHTSTTDYLVYSVGVNGVDDGGSDQPPERPADIVVRVSLAGGDQSD